MTKVVEKAGYPDSPTHDISSCGILMPISAFGEYDADHWSDVRNVMECAIVKAGFDPKPVWERTETDIIQSRIVRNLYENEIAVCDISGLNPNVMFELGLRLAFKKPVIVVVDELTKIPFDTNVIEHIFYQSDLHYQKTEKFIDNLSSRLLIAHQAFKSGNYTAYIDAFGAFSTFEPKSNKIEFDQFVLDKLEEISLMVARLGRVQEHEAIYRNEAAHGQHISSMPTSLGWTDARIEILKNMWEEGKTASQIAEALGGVSRNAVIGRAHRLDLQSRPLPISSSSDEL